MIGSVFTRTAVLLNWSNLLWKECGAANVRRFPHTFGLGCVIEHLRRVALRRFPRKMLLKKLQEKGIKAQAIEAGERAKTQERKQKKGYIKGLKFGDNILDDKDETYLKEQLRIKSGQARTD